jgi:hypothetical protein
MARPVSTRDRYIGRMIKKFGQKSNHVVPPLQKVKEKRTSANLSPEAAKKKTDDAKEKADKEKNKGKKVILLNIKNYRSRT